MARKRAKRALHLPIVALIFAACVAATGANTAVAPDPEAPEEWTYEPWRGNAFNLTKFFLPWHWPSRSFLYFNWSYASLLAIALLQLFI